MAMTDAPPLETAISLHQNEAEWRLAAASFISPEYARESCGWLKPEYFRDPRLRGYWGSLMAGKTQSDAAMENGVYWNIAEYMGQVVTYFDAPAFANAIAQDRYLFRAAGVLPELARAISNRDIEGLRKLTQAIAESSPTSATKLPSAVDIGLEFLTSLDNVGSLIVPTGIKPVDRNMGGWDRSTLNIVGGRPGMGKTSFGLQCAVEDAKLGFRTLYFSLEMSARDLWQRLACGRAEVDWRKIKSKVATDEEIEKVKQATADLMDEMEDRFIVEAAPMTSSEDIFRRVGEIRPDLIVVDHLDLVDRKDRGKLREDIRVGNISRMGKVTAKQFDIPAVYLVQLNRGTEDRQDKRPVLSDLRNSGEIEQDADTVSFLYRPDYYDRDKRGETVVDCEIWLEKVRNGTSGVKVETKLNLLKQHFYRIDYHAGEEE